MKDLASTQVSTLLPPGGKYLLRFSLGAAFPLFSPFFRNNNVHLKKFRIFSCVRSPLTKTARQKGDP